MNLPTKPVLPTDMPAIEKEAPMEAQTPNVGFSIDDDTFDEDLANEGVWMDFFSGSRLKLAATESKLYKSSLAQLARKHRIQLDATNKDSIELVNRITCECLAKYVLKDWENIIVHGEMKPYSVALGIECLLASKKLRDFVTEAAENPSNFQAQTAEAAAK